MSPLMRGSTRILFLAASTAACAEARFTGALGDENNDGADVADGEGVDGTGVADGDGVDGTGVADGEGVDGTGVAVALSSGMLFLGTSEESTLRALVSGPLSFSFRRRVSTSDSAVCATLARTATPEPDIPPLLGYWILVAGSLKVRSVWWKSCAESK